MATESLPPAPQDRRPLAWTDACHPFPFFSSLYALAVLHYFSFFFIFSLFLNSLKKFFFEITLSLQKICQNSTASPNILRNHGVFVKTKKLTWVQYY